MIASRAVLTTPLLRSRMRRRDALLLLAAASPLVVAARVWGPGGAGPAARLSVPMPYTLLRAWGGPGVGVGQLRTPYHLAVNGHGEVLVADVDNRQAQGRGFDDPTR